VNDARKMRVTMGWVPEGAFLMVDYRDTWKFGPEHFRQTTSWPYEEAGGDEFTKRIDFGKGGVHMHEDRHFDLAPSKARAFSSESRDYRFHAWFAVQLHIALGEHEFLVPLKPKKFEIDISSLSP
jgi:hypothetical protein